MGFSYVCEEVVTQIASRIQGITVEIGGDTTKLSKALESINKSIKGTQSGLKDVNKLLKLDPSNEKSERYPCGLPCGAARIIMGEKRAYKAREPGGGRKKLKPEYDAGKNLKEQMDTAVVLYGKNCSLQSIADSLDLNPIKIRKLLITTGVYESEVAEKVQDTFEEYREAQSYKEAILSTANTLQLSKVSVTSYLPYQKGVYFPSTAAKLFCCSSKGKRTFTLVT